MTLDFTNRDCNYLYKQLCGEARKDLDGTKRQIREYFTKNRVDELELYKEKIYAAKIRSDRFESSFKDVMYSILIPSFISTLTFSITIALVVSLNLSEENPIIVTLPLYISVFSILLYMFWLAFTRRSNSKSEKEWTNINRVLYFLENYKPE